MKQDTISKFQKKGYKNMEILYGVNGCNGDVGKIVFDEDGRIIEQEVTFTKEE